MNSKADSITVNDVRYFVNIFVVVDFKLYYYVMRMSGPNGVRKCSYCQATNREMDLTTDEFLSKYSILSIDQLNERSTW